MRCASLPKQNGIQRLPVSWRTMLSGPPISAVTSSIGMPICSLANLPLRAGVPTLSPSNVPSRDLTTRVGPNGLGAGEVGDADWAGCAAATGGDAAPGLAGWGAVEQAVMSAHVAARMSEETAFMALERE